MSFTTGALVLALVTALTCALPGTFIVLRKNSMLVDAMAHAVLPGIVVGYLITRELNSPVLILGAAVAGLVVVLGNEWLIRTGLVTGDAPQGLIFPALFSIGVLLITVNVANIHLDTHAVLVGDLNLAAWDHVTIGGTSWGPSYMYVMLGALAVNLIFIACRYHELAITTFDPQFATSIGIRTARLHTAFMFLVSLTVTAAFNAAGAILVLALMIIPPASAYLLSTRLPVMLALCAVIALSGAFFGFWIAYALNAATSAGMALVYGLIFVTTFVGVRARQRRAARSCD